jgi:Mg-chelatase subunit ChlD
MREENGLIKLEAHDDEPLIIVNSRGIIRANKPLAARADVVLAIDTTGSMSDKIDGLLKTLEKFAETLVQKQIDWRLAIFAFGDLTVTGDKIVNVGFTRSLEAVRRSLKSIPRFSGGGNSGESSLETLDQVLKVTDYRPDAIKVCLLLTDEPPLTHQFRPVSITRRLREAGILTFVISDSQREFISLATETGGQWFPISAKVNFLSILDQLFVSLAQTVGEVQTEAAGSVQRYLLLKSGK